MWLRQVRAKLLSSYFECPAKIVLAWQIEPHRLGKMTSALLKNKDSKRYISSMSAFEISRLSMAILCANLTQVDTPTFTKTQPIEP
jgi:hypothetical protein